MQLARLAVLAEIVGGQWIIPAERTKMRRRHIVPLSDAAKEVLELARGLPRQYHGDAAGLVCES